MLRPEVLIILVKAYRDKMRIVIIMLRLSALKVNIYLNTFWVRGPYRQIIFAVFISSFYLLPIIAFLNLLALVFVMPISGLFQSSVLIAAPNKSCLPALLTVSNVLKLMTRLVVMLALIIQNGGYRHA